MYGFGGWGLGVGVWGLRLRHRLQFQHAQELKGKEGARSGRVLASRGLEIGIWGLGFWVWGFGFWVEALEGTWASIAQCVRRRAYTRMRFTRCTRSCEPSPPAVV